MSEEGKISTCRGAERIRLIASLALLLIVCGFIAIHLIRAVSGYLPYPRHMDEPYVTERAERILKTNDWNPHYFNYSSFPIYVTAAGFSAGYLKYCGETKIRPNIADIKSVGYPYYRPVDVVAPARYFFAAMILLSLILCGWIGYRLLGAPEMLALVPFLGFFSWLLQSQSITYINVDVLACLMTALALAAIIRHADSDKFLLSGVIPGILCGLAIAAKYTYCWILITALLAIWMYKGKWKGYRSIVLTLCMVLGFLAVVPWAILDLKTFLNELGAQAFSYAQGRPNWSCEPGWPNLAAYLREIIKENGIYTVPIALTGLAYMLMKDFRIALLFLSFPLINLVHLSTNRLHYSRNAIFAYICYAVLLAAGFVALIHIIHAVIRKIERLNTRPFLRYSLSGCLIVLLAIFILPWNRHLCFANIKPDTRNQASDWVKANIPKGVCILAPEDLGLDVERLKNDGYCVLVRDYAQYTPESFRALTNQLGILYAYMPEWGAYEKKDEQNAARKNALRDSIFSLKQYKGNKVGAFYKFPVFHGDPAFSFGLITPDAATPTPAWAKKMSVIDKYDIANGSGELKNALPPDFRKALLENFSPEKIQKHPVNGDLDFVSMNIRRIDSHVFDCRFLFFVKKTPGKDWRFFFHGNVEEVHLQDIPEQFRKGRRQMWNFDPNPPLTQWQKGQLVMISNRIDAADIPFDILCGFFLGNEYYGAKIPLGKIDFSKI